MIIKKFSYFCENLDTDFDLGIDVYPFAQDQEETLYLYNKYLELLNQDKLEEVINHYYNEGGKEILFPDYGPNNGWFEFYVGKYEERKKSEMRSPHQVIIRHDWKMASKEKTCMKLISMMMFDIRDRFGLSIEEYHEYLNKYDPTSTKVKKSDSIIKKF